jgi:MFS family permease
MAVSTLLAGPALFGALILPDGPGQLVVLALAGLVAFAATPVQMVMIQELLPDNRSTAMGLMMFLGLEGTVIATAGVGFVADAFGLGPTLGATILLSTLSLPFVLLLPETRQGEGSAPKPNDPR